MHEEIPLLFGLQGSDEYAARVALQLNTTLAEHEEREFEDGECKVRPLEPVRDRAAVVVHSLYADDQRSVNDKLCRLLFFCATLKDAGARRVTALTPYLCYARKERRTQAQDPIISRYVAGLMESCGVDQLIALEVHDLAAIENAYRIPTQALSSAQLFADFFAPLVAGQEVVAVSPDAGGSKRAELFRQALEHRTGQQVGSAYMEKYRSNDLLRGSLLAGEVRDKLAIIVDDLISSGGTLQRAAQACHAAGARRIFAAAAHGLFTGGPGLLLDPLFERILITDSVPTFRLEPGLAARRLTVLDSTALLAAALRPGSFTQWNSRT